MPPVHDNTQPVKLVVVVESAVVFRREVLSDIDLKSDRFGFEPEITAKIAKGNWRIYEVPISYAGRTYAEGKKITWKDGLSTLWYILRFNLFG